MNGKIQKKIVIISVLIFFFSSIFYKVQASEENLVESNISTTQIIESQSDSLRNIKFYRRSK